MIFQSRQIDETLVCHVLRMPCVNCCWRETTTYQNKEEGLKEILRLSIRSMYLVSMKQSFLSFYVMHFNQT
jgi:hypothetical protein